MKASELIERLQEMIKEYGDGNVEAAIHERGEMKFGETKAVRREAFNLFIIDCDRS